MASFFAFSTIVYAFVFVILLISPKESLSFSESMEKTPTVTTKYGKLRGIFRILPKYNFKVATYLGVPYATPPVGPNRFSPTRTLSQWVGVHEATHFGPACPQRFPEFYNMTVALTKVSRAKFEMFQRIGPILKRQSEDCLYLNLYVPYQEMEEALSAFPVVVFIHGQSYEWGSSSLYDGSFLAAFGRVIVVTVNYRLGILGFFNPNVDPIGRPTVANYGLMDQLAALHWVQENIVRFGGDPGLVTVMGHGAAAASLNFLVISPAATNAGLFKRAILMSGSSMSPWASVHHPVQYAVRTAAQLNCEIPDDPYLFYDVLLQCLRNCTVEQILEVDIEAPQFLSAIGPSVDGVTIKPGWQQTLSRLGKEDRTPVDILYGVTSMDVNALFSEYEIQNGFENSHRDRLLRTYVANNYQFHLQEIVLAITSEYTDWERPVQHPMAIRDLTAEALHDASLVAPVVTTAVHLATSSKNSYLYILDLPVSEENKNVLLNELLYVFGAPLGCSAPLFLDRNYTLGEEALSEAILDFWSNFIKTGNPNDEGRLPASFGNKIKYRSQNWEVFDPVFRKFFEMSGTRGRMDGHYRASKVALWSWLVPGLERVGSRYGPESPLHHLPDHHRPDTFSGPVRPRPLVPAYLPPPSTSGTTSISPSSTWALTNPQEPTLPYTPYEHLSKDGNTAELHDQIFSYTTALSLTIAIGTSLLVLNLLVFAAVYYRREGASREPKLSSPPASDESPSDLCHPDIQMRPNENAFKPGMICGNIRSSATLRSSLAASCEDDIHHQEWPPDYSSCCPVEEHSHPMEQVMCVPPPHNGTATLRISRPPMTPRTSTATLHVESQPLLSPAALLQASVTSTSSACTELRL